MAPSIHITDALWHRLGQQAKPFEDPQQVLERLIAQAERSEGERLQLDYQTLTEIKDLVEHDDQLSTVINRYIRIHPGQTGEPQQNHRTIRRTRRTPARRNIPPMRGTRPWRKTNTTHPPGAPPARIPRHPLPTRMRRHWPRTYSAARRSA